MNSPGATTADPYSARVLIKRLLTEYAAQHIRLYVLAGVMMIIGAACMAVSAYLIGDMINQAYVNRNFPAILALSIATTILYSIRGVATYGQAVLMSRIGTRIVAENHGVLRPGRFNVCPIAAMGNMQRWPFFSDASTLG